MGLTSALFTGLSGLDVNQTRLNVIGNNIANANTTAFKSSRAMFKTQFYVTDTGGAAPDTDFGGSNPSQRGLGASVAAIEKDFKGGAIQNTGQDTDMAIEGDGFFVVKGTDQRYTRDGSFSLNSAHQLVTVDGSLVQGFGVDAKGNVLAGQLQDITIPVGNSITARPTSTAVMQGNLNAGGLPAAGASVLLSEKLTTVGGVGAPTAGSDLTTLASATAPTVPLFSAGEVFTLKGQKGGRDLPPATFTVNTGSKVSDLLSFYQQNLGIDTTVPTTSPVPGATMEADPIDPNGAHLVIAGNTGTENALTISGSGFTSSSGATPLAFADGTNTAGVASNASGESIHTSFEAYDSLGTPVTVDVTAVLESKADTGDTWRFYADSADNKAGGLTLGNGTLTFDSNGQLKASTGTNIVIDRSGTGAGTPLAVKLDFSGMSGFTGHSSTLVMSRQDGSSAGTLNSFTVGENGTITGAYSNGLTRNLGRVALAMFSNPQGLVDKGSNSFVAGANSGNPIITNPLDTGAGAIRAGSLEQSNVDLSEEFTGMIVASTGFSAASRVITTSNQLIQELLNSSR